MQIVKEILLWIIGLFKASGQEAPPQDVPQEKPKEEVKFMISMEELLNGAKLEDQSKEIQDNLKVLLERVNNIRIGWGKPMKVTSGLRTKDDQMRIYREKAVKKQFPFKDGVFDEKKVPMGSQHLKGGAVDIYDPDLKLTAWLKDSDSKRLVDAQLWCEEGNTNWVHFQINPPKSGNRWFLP